MIPKFISALGMPSSPGRVFRAIALLMLGLSLPGLFSSVASGEVLLERVVAVIDEKPVFWSEYQRLDARLKIAGSWVSEDDTLTRLIDRKLLEFEARRLRLDVGMADASTDAMVQKYIELMVRGGVPDEISRMRIRPIGPGKATASDPAQEEQPGIDADSEGIEARLDAVLKQLRQRYEIRIPRE